MCLLRGGGVVSEGKVSGDLTEVCNCAVWGVEGFRERMCGVRGSNGSAGVRRDFSWRW